MPTISELQTRIDALTTSSDAFDFAYLAVESANTSANLSFVIQLGSDLPDLSNVDVGSGTIFFVEELGAPVYADMLLKRWLGFDNRVYRADGPEARLYTWGCNSAGQLGDGSSTSRSSPGTTAGGGTTWCQVSVGESQIGAIKTDGTLWTWGCNHVGILGNGTGTNRCSPGTTAGGGINWCQVGTGERSMAAVKTDGTLWTWGCGGYGAIGDNSTTNRNSPVTTAGGGKNWRQVDVGNFNMAAVKTDGTLWTWGFNSGGRLGDGTTIDRCSPGTTAGAGTNWCQVSIGATHSSAVKTDGTLWGWGYNATGNLGDGTTTARSSPVTTSGGGTTWCQVSVGDRHTLALKTDGTLWSWGANRCGNLGEGSTNGRSSPGTTAGGGTNWCQTAINGCHSAAIKTDGTLWTWGCNSVGNLGDGSTTNRCSPVTTAGGGTMWCQVSAGCGTTAAIELV